MKEKTQFSVDPTYRAQADEYLATIPDSRLEGVSCIGANDIRIWWADTKTEKLKCVLLPAKGN